MLSQTVTLYTKFYADGKFIAIWNDTTNMQNMLFIHELYWMRSHNTLLTHAVHFWQHQRSQFRVHTEHWRWFSMTFQDCIIEWYWSSQFFIY